MDDAKRGRQRGQTRLSKARVLRWTLLHVGALVGGGLFFSWSAVAVASGLLGVTMCLGVSVGFHRGLIHRGFQTSRTVEAVLAVVGSLAGLGGVIGMSRMHHMRDYHQNQPSCPPYFGYEGGFLEAMAYALFYEYRAPDASVYPPVDPHLADARSSAPWSARGCGSRCRWRWCCTPLAAWPSSPGASSSGWRSRRTASGPSTT